MFIPLDYIRHLRRPFCQMLSGLSVCSFRRIISGIFVVHSAGCHPA
ncbi:MAG: hypothetical protein SPF23_06980 [Paludibacteraceae bacterium]|nr:hypothetical protein [Paludibacteraceae bacterium]